MIFQHFEFIDPLGTVFENVALPLPELENKSKAGIPEKTAHFLALVGLVINTMCILLISLWWSKNNLVAIARTRKRSKSLTL